MVYPLIIYISLTSLYYFIGSTINPSFKKETRNIGCKYPSSMTRLFNILLKVEKQGTSFRENMEAMKISGYYLLEIFSPLPKQVD